MSSAEDSEEEDDGGLFDNYEYNVDDIAEGNHFDHLKSEDSSGRFSESFVRKTRVEDILKYEAEFMSDLRTSCSKMSERLLHLQELDLRSAFAEVDYLRAELAELVPNTEIPTLKKGIVVKYITANRKELSSRLKYSELSLQSAQRDASEGMSSEDWQDRVESDASVVKATRKIRNDNKVCGVDVVMRKKSEYDYNRAKAVLKADSIALSSAWPGVNYSHLSV